MTEVRSTTADASGRVVSVFSPFATAHASQYAKYIAMYAAEIGFPALLVQLVSQAKSDNRDLSFRDGRARGPGVLRFGAKRVVRGRSRPDDVAVATCPADDVDGANIARIIDLEVQNYPVLILAATTLSGPHVHVVLHNAALIMFPIMAEASNLRAARAFLESEIGEMIAPKSIFVLVQVDRSQMTLSEAAVLLGHPIELQLSADWEADEPAIRTNRAAPRGACAPRRLAMDGLATVALQADPTHAHRAVAAMTASRSPGSQQPNQAERRFSPPPRALLSEAVVRRPFMGGFSRWG